MAVKVFGAVGALMLAGALTGLAIFCWLYQSAHSTVASSTSASVNAVYWNPALA
ncbi:hypothetical protein [Streptomyces boninensis]|uniref:hypothetical protein n=1 Tax=Streptomyces boninensis TaxID=2039455 RepID=UPI003B2184B6